ncbi:hypothetical protein FisN_6Lh328 [Fistulifera solaris]|uniref:RNase III domain-containing protein n=1 Tax=Fistulifera solaris TaxID=1519565 RepID=A0A1Z5JKK5_FISSO|nr:hypothetical protein FisN_6Lh328 [Fistulifera solaris]|eukprot:GAX14550.1 hypothetical protein FisN_6Lh328 [Fistulifera solaris]
MNGFKQSSLQRKWCESKLPFSFSFANGRGEGLNKSRNVDEDDNSLESLATECPITIEKSTEAVFQLYDWLQKEPSRNPISLLMQYYDDKAQRTRLQEKKLNVRDNIRCESLSESKIWWRFYFECPLSGIKVSSGLPQALLQSPDSTTFLAKATRNFFSADYITIDGCVYWDKKQAAKASCALVAILRLDPSRLGWHDGAVPLFVTEQPIPLHDAQEEECLENGYDQFPDWVRTIHDLGIRKPEISFHQESDLDECDDWNLTKPTRLYCKIFVRDPVRLSVTGTSCTSKSVALQSAVQELHKHLDVSFIKRLSPHNANSNRKSILQALPQSTHYNNKLPSWASSPFERNETYFLYELVLKTKSGKLVAEEKIPWIQSRKACTRIGVLLPKDPLSHSDACASYSDTIQFQALVEDGKLASCQVELVDRTVLRFDNDEGQNVSNSLQELVAFNELLAKWKQYGFGKQYDSAMCASRKSQYAGNECYLRDRTYMFVPLDSKSSAICIDWHCINETVRFRRARPLYDANFGDWIVPYLGKLDKRFPIITVFFFGWCVFAGQDTWSSKALAFVILMWGLLSVRKEPRSNFCESVICNRFLRHCGDLYAPHAIASSHNVSSNSKLIGFRVKRAKKEQLKTRFGLDLDTATFSDYYLKKYDVRIQYGHVPMIRASRINKHADANPMESPPPEPVYLVPELCSLLPLPRDFVYILDQADSFMPFLERKIDVRRLATSAIHSCLRDSSAATCLDSIREVEAFSRRFTDLIFVATTRCTVKAATPFERLEFFGDRVLAFFVALALTESHFCLSETYSTPFDSLSTSAKNRSIAGGALEIGLPRLILSKRCSWSSAYSYNHSQKGETLEFPDCFLSDVFEACVAATFLASQRCDEELRLLKALLEKAKLPMEGSAETISFSGKELFESSPLGKMRSNVVKEYFSNIPSAASNKLKKGLEVVDKVLGTQLTSKAQEDCSLYSLILCSLYNAEINYFAIYNENLCCPDLSGFAELKNTWSLLKMLNVIGCRALQLGVTSYLYERYPHITAGDLMLLFSIVVSEDTLAYIFTKNGLHNALFDDGVADNFIGHSRRAEILGKESWDLHGGWLVPGGTEEFRKRSCSNRDPAYTALRGGRLCGKTKKVGPKDTSVLTFSFHALIGAFVTTMGFDKAWNYLQPLFVEVMLLSPNEVREFGTSSLVENYMSGS